MTAFLPPNLLALFAPRDPLPYFPPTDKLPHERKRPPYLGVAQFMHSFEDPKDTPKPKKPETREERREKKRREKAEMQAYKIEQGIALWSPHDNTRATSDPYKTLFVSRINYDTSESKLRREFEVYGPIRKVIMVNDGKQGKPRGYAFIEYEHERDMHAAYKQADGKKIDGRRVLVDVERGRTVKGWLPRRLGGGLGNTRKTKTAEESRESRERSEQRRGDRERDRDRDHRHSRSREWGAGDRGGSAGERDRERGARRRSRSRSPADRDRGRDRGDRDRGRDRPAYVPDDRRGGNRDSFRGDRGDRDRDRNRDRGDRERPRFEGRGGEERNERERDRGHKDRETKREPKAEQDFESGNGNY